MATSAADKPQNGKPKSNASASKSAATRKAAKSSRQSARPAIDRRLKAIANRGRAIGVSRNQAAGALAVTAVGIGVGLLLNWLRHRDDEDQYSPAAFAEGETVHRENFDQTRDAGPDAMRDNDGDDWDRVDQALDESFPASDPASTY